MGGRNGTLEFSGALMPGQPGEQPLRRQWKKAGERLLD